MTCSLTKLDRYFYLIKVVVNNFEDKLSKKKKSNREEKISRIFKNAGFSINNIDLLLNNIRLNNTFSTE